MKIKEMIVVEGRDDTRRIQEAVEADTIETNGSAIDEKVLKMIEKAQEVRGVIVLTDPDFPGGKIREAITQRVPEAKHAFLKKEDCQSPKGGSLGVEHASNAAIRFALQSVHTPSSVHDDIAEEDLRIFLLEAGFIGKTQSSHYRKILGDALGIGHTNGKQLLKRLRSFQITKRDIQKAMCENGISLSTDDQKEVR
ncbi:ribonuclease M5 [Jeotgalibaca sp. MA1X17-3]|uniref:ribonuclease M5 n=1 Tax=Jeotgalibaca sp. MA1X17-3 TaxID=2908211 RepID=UPI001F22950A|nr:ribonuclease M5 [Jeotgalibaca sp. MA1X17-3]UJF16190.1 ribonuclease M5 [Jeotgalibaca sp. MA1X17-3]